MLIYQSFLFRKFLSRAESEFRLGRVADVAFAIQMELKGYTVMLCLFTESCN